MSFLRKLIKTNNNRLTKSQSLDTSTNDESIRRKVDRKLAMCQSDPEPILDLTGCQLKTITAQIQTTIKIYCKTDCRFDENYLEEFGIDSVHYLCSVRALHLSYNHIHTIGDNISLLLCLKELYISHNQLNSLPDCISRLPALKILAIRDNQLDTFPDGVTRCPSLSCLDLGDNRIKQIPPTLLRLRLLKSLQLDGNPLETPEPDVCGQGLDAILAYLQRNTNEDYSNDTDCGHNNGCNDSYTGDIDDEKHGSIVENIEYQNYHNLKDQKKRALIEWERQFQSGNSETTGLTADEADKKRELLSKLWADERQMSADINHRQVQKDKDRQSLLDNMSQLDKHSAQLLDSLCNWEDRHRQQLEALESDERQMLDRMMRYDKEVVVRKNAILIAMQEVLSRESTARALTDDLKEFNQLEVRTQINQQERLQRQAFEALQRSRDYKSRQLSDQIGLIEAELSQLTRAEMQRRDERLDTILGDIRTKRRELASLLARLLAAKRERDVQLRQRVLDIERRRLEVGAADDTEYWLRKYQCLMDRQPLDAQLRLLAIDERVCRVLISVHSSSGGQQVANYLPLFTGLAYDRLNAMSDKQILELGVDDYDLCQLIRDKLDEQQTPKHTGDAVYHEVRPSAPDILSPISPMLTPPTVPIGATGPADTHLTSDDQPLIQLSGQLAEVRLWRETECVVCFEIICDVVFLPCGHVCTCTPCSLPINACPLCRVPIDDKLSLNLNNN